MADTFSNDLRLRLQESGSNAGTWGDLLNGTITNIASALGQGSEAIPNASTHTITLADGTADEARSLYLKCTGGGQACTVTLGPNTISKVWIIDNTTSYTLTFSQGSGANVAIAAGAVKVIATDGAGSGAAVVDTLDGLEGSMSTLAVSGNVGIGRDPRVALDVNGEVAIAHNATYGLRFYNQPQNNWSSIGNNLTSAAANLVFKDSTGEVMRIESGNLLVGKSTTALGTAGLAFGGAGFASLTRSGAEALNINRLSSDGALAVFYKDGTTVGSIGSNAAGGTPVLDISANSSSGIMRMLTSGTERMRISSSGSVGIGTVPSAWRTAYADKALDLGTHSALYDQFGGSTFLVNNFYRSSNGDFKYKTTAGVTAITLDAGSVGFMTGPSGTAGATATLTERMKLSAAGHLILSTDAGYMQVTGPSSSAWAFGSTGGNNVPGSSSTGMGWHRWNGSSWLSNMYLGPSGVLGVFGSGTTSPRGDTVFTSGTSISSKRWGFGGGATGNNTVFYVINEGNVGVYLAHGNQAWIAHSDERIKENITDVGTVLPSLMNMRCVKYNLISNPTNTKIGFIAQDWESAFPEIVDENEHLVLEDDGTIGTDDDSDSTTPVKAMAYTETIPLLLKAIQEQQATIEALTQRIQTLENN